MKSHGISVQTGLDRSGALLLMVQVVGTVVAVAVMTKFTISKTVTISTT